VRIGFAGLACAETDQLVVHVTLRVYPEAGHCGEGCPADFFDRLAGWAAAR